MESLLRTLPDADKTTKRLSKQKLRLVTRQVNKQLRNLSPVGAAHNTAFQSADIGKTIAHVQALQQKAQSELDSLRKTLPTQASRWTPSPVRRGNRRHSMQMTLSRSPRTCCHPGRRARRTFGGYRSKADALIGWEHRPVRFSFDTTLFHHFSTFATELSNSIRYSCTGDSFEDIVALRRSNRKIDKRCRRETVKLKREIL